MCLGDSESLVRTRPNPCLCECGACVVSGGGGGVVSPGAPAAAGSPPRCPLSCTLPAHQHCPSSHTEPVEEQGFVPLGQLPTLCSLGYLCPLLSPPAWLARKAHYVALPMATSISSPGGPSPPAHPPHLFPSLLKALSAAVPTCGWPRGCCPQRGPL